MLDPEGLVNVGFPVWDTSLTAAAGVSSDFLDSYNLSSSYGHEQDNGYSGTIEKHRKQTRSHDMLFSPAPISLSSRWQRSYDVYIGMHGPKPSLSRFANWLRAELEIQGMSCFVSDRARYRNSGKQTWEGNGRTMGKNGGELWGSYGGLEKEWKEAVHGLVRANEWKLEAPDGCWRDCILRAVTLLAMRLGRRSVIDRLTKWIEKVDKEEFPFPRNENFVGRKKELSELEFILFGDISGESERGYDSGSGSQKGKEPVIWKESEKEIEMQSTNRQQCQRHRSGRNARRKRSTKFYGKGIACVTGDSGTGKIELLEFAYRYHQRNCIDKRRMTSFEEQEEAAISRVRKELMRNISFLGSIKDYPIAEIDVLRIIEEKVGRLTLGLAIDLCSEERRYRSLHAVVQAVVVVDRVRTVIRCQRSDSASCYSDIHGILPVYCRYRTPPTMHRCFGSGRPGIGYPGREMVGQTLCWRPTRTNAQLNPSLWQELALSRATVVETRAKLMLKGGQFDIGDDLIRKAIFIRNSICGEDHQETVSARETLSKLTRF
ncbi:puromycin-sensitive aminopeptidase-like isoform X1 [Hibiscus syriacus]|uniref:Puromycin-sensitive aminopeptidase-like isoform X1 n=1 Tax=Hibiscus syriacus TaxID=106335 RepID=A0A6A3AYW6_HIBSY|nr:puromycin-sensitive aminopeptidase-like isoform X1 [Hibiscus syriacus]